MDPQKITELANLFRVNGDKILNSEFTLTLSGSLLRALNDSFTLIADSVETGDQQKFQVTKPINSKSPVFRDLQLVHDFVQKTTLLCIVHYPTEDYFTGTIDIKKFHALRRLETRKINVRQIIGIQPLRAQLQELICIKSLDSVDEIITHCGGDRSNGFVWNELKIADFSYNSLKTLDTSLEFAQYLQHLNLRHNKLHSVEAIKWLPHLKSLDLSYNCLQCLPQFHADAYKRLLRLNVSNNFIEDLVGIAKMDALCELDLSDNCLLNHTCLLPLSAIMTLTNLNLYGNPLHCHPKHRLATAQFLHKNTATVKFLLDLEPLTRNEKAVTGKHQMRHASTLHRYTTKSSSVSLSSSNHATPSTQTPSSSVGSLLSFRFQDAAATTTTTPEVVATTKKKNTKIRTVEIEDKKTETTNDVQDAVTLADNKDFEASTSSNSKLNKKEKADLLTQSLFESSNAEHLEAKKHIETLREKYGSKWLQSDNAEMVHSVLGIESNSLTSTNRTEKERNISRQLFNEFLGEFSETAMQAKAQLNNNDNNSISNKTMRTSTPMNETNNPFEDETKNLTYTPIKNSDETLQNPRKQNENTLYVSLDNNDSISDANDQKSLYTTADNINSTKKDDEISEEIEDPKEIALRNVYATAVDAESEDSELEDEETYIVYTNKNNIPLFLTLSENFLREKDIDTHRTKTKWSLKILESCERLRSNIFRINFDTIKADKKERIYTVEEDLCQELERKLRHILSQRDLSEMNQTIYRCVNCSCQFSRENKTKTTFVKQDIRCPTCNSTFIAEIHETPKSLSPAAIVEEEPSKTITPALAPSSSRGILQTQESADSVEPDAETSNSIGSKLTTHNTAKTRSKSKPAKKSSATSLNESSSCSKLSQRSQSSFDSNQSVVGSTNSERDLDFNVNCESDVDIISNPSQSSIEVLDRISFADFEDRRISQQPNLETIDDNSFRQTYTDWHLNSAQHLNETAMRTGDVDQTSQHSNKNDQIVQKLPAPAEILNPNTATLNPLAHLQLTESSSSGSVTDSICTTYAPDKPREIDDKIYCNNMLAQERSNTATAATALTDSHKVIEESATANAEQTVKSDDANGRTPLKNFYQTLFQSTNTLMSSSKKLIAAETTANIKPGEKLPPKAGNTATAALNRIVPYKFDYNDFNNIDHRLKLYYYQTKFQDVGEHFKWLVRGRIYNEKTGALNMGIVVMSTTRLYLMEAFANENDDVTKWLRPVITVSVDRLESIQLLPWKLGCAFQIRDWGGFLLLLQDILRTDSLLLYFANNPLPNQCELLHQPAERIAKRLNQACNGEQLNMFALLNGCEISCDNAKRNLQICGLLTTDTHLFLTTNNLAWLSQQSDDFELECCITQLMSNLVEIEEIAEDVRIINFLDETHNKTETWRLTFETKENADSTLNAIDQSWQKLFGVSLFGA